MPLYNPPTIAAGATTGGALTVAGDLTATGGNVIIGTAGKGLQVKTGSNARAGTATLASGTATVANTSVTANSLIFVTDVDATIANTGYLAVSAKVVGTSFTVTSSNATDSGTFNWLIVEGI